MARLRSGVVALLLLLAAAPRSATAGDGPARHPLHTAVVELTHDPAARAASIVIRVFADDLEAALGGATGDSAFARYVRAGLRLEDRAGRLLPLRWTGAERAGDVYLLRLQAVGLDGLAGVRVRATLLAERFDDQVNLVRATYRGRTVTLLFVGGDAARPLP